MTREEALLKLMEHYSDIGDSMPTVYINNDDELEFEKAKKEMKEKGFKLASISNAGLKHPTVRLTFLPDSAFKNSSYDGKDMFEKGFPKTKKNP